MGGRLSRSKTRAPVRVPEPISPFIPPHINNRPRRKRRGEEMALGSSKCRSTVEVEAPVVPSLTVAKKAERQSDSPIKPEPNAMEPSEEAKCAPSPSSSGAYDADQSDVCSERPEVVVEESGVPDSATGVVTQDMIDEEKALKRQAEADDLQKREEREKEWARLEQEDKEERFERLKHLLQRSNMYTEYLINRMKRQQEEMTKKKERRQKKVAKEEEKKKVDESKAALKEEPSANGNGQEVAVPEITHNLRHKRKTEETDNALSPKAAAPKRRRTAKTDEEKADKENEQAQKEAMEQMETEQKDGEAKKEGEKEEKGEIKKEGMDEVDGQTASTSPKQTLSGGTLAPMKFNPFIADMGEARVYDGEAVPDAQPLMMTGGVLRPYQVDGYMWLRTLFENGMNGILADEMGLGKTVQCVAMLAHMVYMGVPGPFLICAPLSTIPNWYSEFQRFAPQVPVLLYHGHKEERKALRNKINRAHTVREGVVVRTVVITSYEVAMMDQRHLQRHEWKYMVVDEGHRIKNTQCRLISALRLYKTTNRLLLTGTPLQNNLAELWSLLNFLLPEIFDDLGSFEAWFDIEHIGDGIAADTQKKDVLSMLHQILTPFMLRRLKTDVDLRIPPKKEVIVYAPLLPLQKEFYSALIDRTIFRKIQEKNGTVEKEAVGANGRPVRKATKNKIDYSLMIASDKDEKECKTSRQKAHEEEEIEGWVQAMVEMQAKRETKVAPEQRVSQLTIKLRNVMMQLRKCCSHPFLLEHPLDKKTGELSLDERVISQSGKMLVLDRMLRELHKRGHKVLIFSQMTKMLDLLEDFCVLRNYGYCRLDGAMNINDRRDNMMEYQKEKSDKFVFLLSTRAGGLGINLTAADTVVIYDSDWNPQCDLQAQDRCHRIGQTRPVMVYRFVTANTIDQRIVERAAAKRKLEKLVIHQGKFKSGIKNFKTSLEPVSSEELLELLNSKDHESEVGQASDEVISDADLDLLLDRSDLERRWKAKQAQADADEEMAVEEEDINIESLLGCLTSKPSTAASTKPTKRQSPNQPTTTKPSPAQRRSAGRGKGSAKKNAKSNSAPAPVAKSLLFKVIDVDDGRPVKMKCEPTAS